MCAVIPLLTAALLALAARAADTCYYPDGSVADKDIPCGSSSSGAACCPQGWQCLDTHICYLDYADYITRFTCTDQSWESSACPQYCLGGTTNGTDNGNVALLECKTNQYCCNGNRSGDCCKDENVSLFSMTAGSNSAPTTSLAQASTSTPTTTAAAGTTEAADTTSAAEPVPTTTKDRSTSSKATSAATTIITSLMTNPTNGAPSTIYLTRTAPAPTQTSSGQASESSSSPNKAVIAGCTVAGSLCAIGIIFLILFCRRRRRQKKETCNDLLPPLPTIPEGNEKGHRISELDGYPRATGGSIAPHRTSGISEHYSSNMSKGHTRAASEVDGTPVLARMPAELESPRNSRALPAELEAVSARASGGYFRSPPAIGGSTAGSSPDPGRGYAVGGVAPPGGLRIVNVAEGELDSEAEGEGGSSASGHGRGLGAGTGAGMGAGVPRPPTPQPPPPPPPPAYQRPVYQSVDDAWKPPSSGGSAAPGSIGSSVSPVSPIYGHDWSR